MANTANSTQLTTNFNVTPYYDDYDPAKGYYRILFKPGYSVQARELTQMQTALQEQLARFGKNIFKDGTIILPGVFTLETNEGKPAGRGVSYVKVKDFDASNNAVNMSEWNTFLNQGKDSGNTRLSIVGATSNITAQIVQVLDGTQTSTDTKTLYVAYTSSSSANASVKAFVAGETLRANVNNTVFTLVVHDTDPEPTGKGSRFSISSGVLFAKNHFIAFPDQAIILDRYNANPTARVGFYITEDIIGASGDTSLLDPAQEASNYSAPGADRLQLNPILDVVPITETPDVQDFVSLFTIEDGVVKTYSANTQYAYINDAMARRTFDNSGDYVVGGLDVQVKEHEDNGSNYGRYTGAKGNNQLLYVGVAPGKAYVSGYQVGMEATTDLSTEKGLTTKSVKRQYSSVNMGQYVNVNELSGGWEVNKGGEIKLYNAAQTRLTRKVGSVGSPTGTQIGSAILLSVQHIDGTPGYDATYNIYLADVRMSGTHTFEEVRALYGVASTGYNTNMFADVILSPITGTAILQNIPDSTLLYFTGSNATDTIRDGDDDTQSATSYEFYDTQGVSSTVQVSTNGVFTITLSPGIEQFPFGTTTLRGSATESIYLTFDSVSTGATSIPVSIAGITAAATSATTLNGTGTYFSRLNIGDKLQLSGNTTLYRIKSIVSDTQVIVDSNLPAANTGNTLSKIYVSGDQIPLNAVGAASGTARTVATTSTSMQFDLKETGYPNPFYVTVAYPVARTTALEIKKTLKPSRYVKINCSTAGLYGPFNLGISDVLRIKSIRLGSAGSFPTSNTDGTNALSSFVFDNGQRDTHYDHASIKPKISLTENSRLLVELDYFVPDFTTGAGYFSIDSYPIEDDPTLFDSTVNIRTEDIPVFKTTTTGQTYDLRNYLDFRPVKTNAAADATTPGTATTNPGSSTTFDSPAAGLKFPIPSSMFEYDYYYYLGRIDIVAVDKDNRFQIIKGQPSSNPQVPNVPPGVMTLAQINVVPYPSLSPAYAAKIGRPELAAVPKSTMNYRFTMRDIATLKQRIVNLEYYTSLSLLEKAANDTKIPNEDGVDRFKNGIFTDSFRDNSKAATYDPENRIVFDPNEKSIRPLYKMDTIAYKYQSGTNVRYNNPVITCDYSEVLHYEQNYCTTDINVERQSWLYLGTVGLFPEQDIWIDTKILPDEKLSTQGIQIVTYGSQGTSNEAVTAYSTTAHIDLSGNSAYGIYTNSGNFLPNTTGGVVDVLNTTNWAAWESHVVGYKVITGKATSDGNPTESIQFTTYDAARNYANAHNPAGGAGVSIETVYNTTRTGTQYWEADSTSIVQTDYKVIDVQNYAYIRPQTIVVNCSGMKPYTQMWSYFDNIAMANNARQITDTQFAWILNNHQYGLPSNTVNDLSKTGIQSVTVTNGGANYTQAPTVTINGDGTGATAYATLAKTTTSTQVLQGKTTTTQYYKVDKIIITDAGQNYTYASVSFNNAGTGGSGAAAQAVLARPAEALTPITPAYLGTWASYGSALKTDQNGNLKFQMKIPANQFRVGQRNVLVCDSRVYVDVGDAATAADIPPDISTGGLAVFTASGQAITKQRSILSTKTVSYHSEAVSQNFNSAGFEYISAPPPPCPCSHSCSAYSFKASSPNGEEGIFLTSIDIFVSRIGKEGFWVEIREMDSGQQITRNTVPYSEVFFNNPANVPISPNGKDYPCKITFPAPVFLYNNTQYALVIHPKNANPDLYVWISRLGQTDVNGLGIVHDRRGTGTFYQTNNNTNWDIIEGIDLAVKFRRAEFNQAQGTAYLGNRPMEKLFIWNNTINFDEHHGEVFISGDHFTLTGANCSPGVGDFAVGDTSKQNSAVVNVSGGLVCAGNTGYYKGEVLHFFSNTGTYKGDATASDIINGSGSLDYYVDGTTSLVHLGQAGGGGFVVGDAIICSSDWSKFGYINSFEAISQFNYSAFHFEPSALNFHLTSMSYTMNTTSSAGTTRTVVDVDPSTTQYFKTEQAVLSRTGELNKLAGANSNIVKVSMKTSSNAVSPLLDTTKTQTILLDTIINNDTTNETLPTHGALINKYITKTVTLAEGQDAEDMQVILSAYRPPGTDVKVWIKILNAFDSSPFADQHWVELYKDGNGDNTYSSIDDRNNFKEFTYKVPGWAYDRLTIANTSGTTLAKVNVGDTLLGLSSGFTATVSNVEGGTIYVMSDSGFAAGETANVSSGGTVYGNTIVTATGRTVALNATVGTTSNVIAYTTDTGVTYASYKYFAIKVGLLNDGINNAVYPRVGDLRAIALQK